MLRKPLDLKLDPTSLYAKLYEAYHTCALLESADGPERLARFSLVVFDPQGEVAMTRGRLRVTGDIGLAPHDGERTTDFLRRVVAAHKVPAAAEGGPAFAGGLVGYTGYEYTEALERLPPRRGPATFPDLQYGLFLDGVVFDRATGTVEYFTTGKDRSRDLLAVAEEDIPDHALRFGPARRNVERSEFENAVRTAKERIVDGDVFQVVLSKRIDAPYHGHLFGYYEALKRVNPSPYMYCLKLGHRAIVGSSPEMLARVGPPSDGVLDGVARARNLCIETFPIAGTRARGKDPAADEQLGAELLADPKERAEHAMLVDLARNDVGRIARAGSVQVAEYARVERYSHVQHIVSRVTGELALGKDAFDAFDSVFPAGTVSGAPKVEAMKIIRELEPDPRGPYAGSVGYFSLNGNADAAITIRTLTAVGGTASVQTGAGIVFDSDPGREYDETEAKARALLAVMEGYT